MKRIDFEARFAELGLKSCAYEDTAYFAESEFASLSLYPFSSDFVKLAKLATDSPDPKQRAALLDTFLSAAHVEKTPEVQSALEKGLDLRTRVGSKFLNFTSIGTEYFLSVME